MEAYHKQRARGSSRLLLDGLEQVVDFDVGTFGTLDPKSQGIVNTCMALLDEDPDSSVLIFVQYHSELDLLSEALQVYFPEDKNAVVTYHGVLQQAQKNARLSLLQSGKVKVFLATLASAGTLDWLHGCLHGWLAVVTAAWLATLVTVGLTALVTAWLTVTAPCCRHGPEPAGSLLPRHVQHPLLRPCGRTAGHRACRSSRPAAKGDHLQVYHGTVRHAHDANSVCQDARHGGHPRRL